MIDHRMTLYLYKVDTMTCFKETIESDIPFDDCEDFLTMVTL